MQDIQPSRFREKSMHLVHVPGGGMGMLKEIVEKWKSEEINQQDYGVSVWNTNFPYTQGMNELSNKPFPLMMKKILGTLHLGNRAKARFH